MEQKIYQCTFSFNQSKLMQNDAGRDSPIFFCNSPKKRMRQVERYDVQTGHVLNQDYPILYVFYQIKSNLVSI